MQDMPKIVRVRLPQATPGTLGAHPDADLLTAFAERSLSKSERERVVDHLAFCGDCREVVALALPAAEAYGTQVSVRQGGGWLSWPVLRWGVIAAGIALVTSVGVLEYKQRTEQKIALVSSSTRVEEKVTAQLGQSLPPETNASTVNPEGRDRTKNSETRELRRGRLLRTQSFLLYSR